MLKKALSSIQQFQGKVAGVEKKIFWLLPLSILLFYLDFVFLVKFQINSIKKMNYKIAKLNTDIKKLTKDLAAMQDLKNKKVVLQQAEVKRNKQFILEGQIPSLLDEISDLANKNNIRIMQLRPFKEPKEEKPSQAEKFTILLVTIDLSSKFHNLGSFINDLENSSRFIALQDLIITRNPNDYYRQDVSLALLTYVKK